MLFSGTIKLPFSSIVLNLSSPPPPSSVPITERITTSFFIFSGFIFASIDAVTGFTVALVIPFFPADGVIVCVEVLGLIVLVSPLSSTTFPATPNIETPDLILLATMFGSMLYVTALTETFVNALYGLDGVKLCADVLGVIEIVVPFIVVIVPISVASCELPPSAVTVPPLFVMAVLAFCISVFMSANALAIVIIHLVLR